MYMQQYHEVGKILAPFGVKGELVFKHHLKKNTDLKKLTCIFIEEKKESFLPYFIEYASKKNDQELLLKLEGINSKEDAIAFTKKRIWLTEKDFKSYADTESVISLLYFTIIFNNQKLGEIVEIIDIPLQKLVKIIINKKEVLIPLNDQTIIKIDSVRKEVHMNIPEGLLEIYLD